MQKEELYNSIKEAFQQGKKNPYSGLYRRIRPGGAELWLETLKKQKSGEIPPDRYVVVGLMKSK